MASNSVWFTAEPTIEHLVCEEHWDGLVAAMQAELLYAVGFYLPFDLQTFEKERQSRFLAGHLHRR